MSVSFQFVRDNRKAVRFILVFAGMYLALNFIYGIYIQLYYPTSDPFTRAVTSQVTWLLALTDPSVSDAPAPFSSNIAVSNRNGTVLYVFEGCNGLNVMIVYVTFLLSFRGSIGRTVRFAAAGLLGIHVFNIIRIGLLYFVTLYFKSQLYFFHKYLFTGAIYVFVFTLWYFWVRSNKDE